MDGKDCIVEEIWYGDPEQRKKILAYLDFDGLQKRWIHLAIDLDSANWNVLHRKTDRRRVIHHLKVNHDAYQCYEYPDGVTIEKIVRVESDWNGLYDDLLSNPQP